MNEILFKVIAFLDSCNRGEATISPEIADKFGERCKELLLARFNEKPREFTVRMSNIGRPLCQLQMQASDAPKDALPYSHSMQMLFGDLIEASGLAIMEGAGVEIEATQGKISYPVSDTESINGTFDVQILKKIWDLKSASPYAFEHKFGPNGKGVEGLLEDDPFGYLAQGYGYGEGGGKEFGGWIVINKVTGEWNVLEANFNEETKKRLSDLIANNHLAIKEDRPFKRCFTDKPETHYRKETGNRVLDPTCGFCSYKKTCWPDLQALPKIPGEGKNRPTVYYTFVEPAKALATAQADMNRVYRAALNNLVVVRTDG